METVFLNEAMRTNFVIVRIRHRNQLFLIAVLLISTILLSCNRTIYQVHRNGVQAAVIDKNVRFISMIEYPPEVRFNPKRSDIDKFERFMANDKELDTLKWAPRQYAGYYDLKTGEKCLFVIVLGRWAAKHSPWKKCPIVIFDDGLWNIKFNLVSQKIVAFCK